MQKFQSTVCECCKQNTNYAIALDRGTALTLLAMANAARRLGRNRIHLLKDMLMEGRMSMKEMVEGGYLTMRMIGNATRPRYHGLIAFHGDGGTGEYVITRKGGEFLHGSSIPKVAIIDKVRGKNGGYWEQGGMVTIFDSLKSKDPAWNWAVTNVRSHTPVLEQQTLSLV